MKYFIFVCWSICAAALMDQNPTPISEVGLVKIRKSGELEADTKEMTTANDLKIVARIAFSASANVSANEASQSSSNRPWISAENLS